MLPDPIYCIDTNLQTATDRDLVNDLIGIQVERQACEQCEHGRNRNSRIAVGYSALFLTLKLASVSRLYRMEIFVFPDL